jgi:hypothetical protein
MNKSMYNKITTAATLYQTQVLRELYEILLIEKANMNEFFDNFLEKNKNLSKLSKTSPKWVTYNKKFAEYSEVDSNIKTAQFYLGRLNAL